jgi:hypothetical protein
MEGNSAAMVQLLQTIVPLLKEILARLALNKVKNGYNGYTLYKCRMKGQKEVVRWKELTEDEREQWSQIKL